MQALESVKMALRIGCAVSALVAACFWIASAKARVSADAPEVTGGWVDASITANGQDFVRTVIRQSRWSARAAVSATVAAVLQAVLLILQ